jgi:hypothetical protein
VRFAAAAGREVVEATGRAFSGDREVREITINTPTATLTTIENDAKNTTFTWRRQKRRKRCLLHSFPRLAVTGSLVH